ncbi:MAG: ParB/RepB/Spo0J family partition protein [Pseudomonadota bacterium]
MAGGDKRLGRGLAALIGEMDRPLAMPAAADEPPTALVRGDQTVPITAIGPNKQNPRQHFDDAQLAELSASIKEHGVVQPILVRPAGDDRYEIIAGERRWRAAQLAELDRVPIVIREVNDRESLELAIIENVQRADLNPVEEALGYRLLMEEHDYRQTDLGQVIGKSRSHVANTLRLLNLPVDVRDMVSDGRISAGHARALVPMEDPLPLARRIEAEGLSVRQVETLASRVPDTKPSTLLGTAENSGIADADSLAQRLSEHLGMKVSISHRPTDNGKLTISYRGLEQLDALEERLLK